MNLWHRLKNVFSFKSCKYVFCVLFPIVLIPLATSHLKELRCAYVMLIVAVYWLLEPVPIAATALLPVVLFPLTGVLHSKDVCMNYMNETLMMFVGSLFLAIAVECCNLHERIALKVLLLIGTDIIWLMLGFMATTMFLSMWISNTATTAMMVPIVDAVVNEMCAKEATSSNDLPLEKVSDNSTTESQDNSNAGEKMETVRTGKSSTVKVALLLSICYSANIGGTGTITGTGPNLVLKALMEQLHPRSDDITFATWMMYNIPGMLICVFIAWIYLYVIYVRCAKITQHLSSKNNIKNIISKRYNDLGRMRFDEMTVLLFFTTLVLLWVFRRPKFITGWADYFPDDVKIGDSAPAIAIAFLMFILPSDPRKFTTGPRLMEWKYAQSKLPWGVLLLAGGGFALANGAKASGLSVLVADYLSNMQMTSPVAIVAIMCFLTATFTEVVTNTTTASIILPVISQMAISMRVNPLFLMLPVAVTCSYAFMLPVATPPNAIAFESGQMKTIQMAKPGFIMNLICCSVQLLMINTLGMSLFNLGEFPEWAEVPVNITDETVTEMFTNITDSFNSTLLISS